MSIADKITSIEEHLTDDYEGLENLGADLTNVNKNIQNIRTCLDNIYSSLPKTTGEGSNLSLSPTLKGKLNIEAYKGDTEQDTTTGKNKLPNQLVSGSANGITYTRNEDGSIKLTGTATARTEPRLMTTSFTIKAGTYKNTTSMSIYWYDTGYKLVTSGSNVTFSSDTTIQYVYIRIESGITINETIYPQLILSSESDTSYEQYTGGQASPNPSYPQPISVVTGTQDVVVQNRNWLEINGENQTINGLTFTHNADKSISVRGTATATTNYVSTTLYEILPNTMYRLSGCPSTGSSSTYRLMVRIRSDETTNVATVSQYGNGQANDGRTTTPANTKYVLGEIQVYSGQTIDLTFKPQFEIITSSDQLASEYTPHQEQTKTLHLGDIELGGIGNYIDRIFEAVEGNSVYDSLSDETKASLTSGAWYIEKNIGKVVLNGSETGWGTQNDVFCIEINDILTQSYEQRSIIVLSNYFLGAITAYRGGINNLTIAKTIDNGRPKQLGIRYDALNNVVADFKTWLSTHNTIVYYVLSTPTYTEITNTTLLNELNELEKMMSYNGQTNISVSGNLPMILNVSALKGE